ncbi:hypothetical protein [Vibrio sp. DNB22_12_1]
MTFDIFRGKCELISPTDFGSEKLTISISLDSDEQNRKKIWFKCMHTELELETLEIQLKEEHTLTEANLGTQSVTLTIEDTSRFRNHGIAGLTLFGATLERVSITLRAAQPNGGWTEKAPFFEMEACWNIKGTLSGNETIGKNQDRVKIDVDANAEVLVCSAFACITPPTNGFGNFRIDDLLVRLRLDSFPISTGWLPIRLFDVSGMSTLHLNGLGRWFAELVGVSLPIFRDKGVLLPDWRFDLPVNIDLPLGLNIKESELRLQKIEDAGNQYAVTAKLEHLLVVWNKTQIADWQDFQMVVQYQSPNKYEIFVQLVEDYFPKQDADIKTDKEDKRYTDYGTDLLPFDALNVSAQCWYFRVGLYSEGETNDLGPLCVDVLLEIGGLKITSDLFESKNTLYETDLRLHTRNFHVLTKDPDGKYAPTPYFGSLTDELPTTVSDFFSPYQQAYLDTHTDLHKTFTFARDLSEPPPEKTSDNDYCIEFIDGEFRKSERLYLAWSQVGAQFLDALNHSLFSTPPAGTPPKEAEKTYLALEVVWFGDDTQIRLDWLDNAKPLNRQQAQASTIWDPIEDSNPPQYQLKYQAGSTVQLPHDGKGVALTPIPEANEPIQVALPGLKFNFARPNARSLILRHEGNQDSLAYLFHYEKPEGDRQFTAQVARAEIGFSLNDPDSGQRDVMSSNTENDEAFITFAVGHGLNKATAIRILGVTGGGRLRIADTLSSQVEPPTILAKETANNASWEHGFPPPLPPASPVVSLGYNDFSTPTFGQDSWQYSVKIQALDSLMNLFGSDQNASPAKLASIKRVIYETQTDDILIETEIALTLSALGDGSGTNQLSGTVLFRFDPADCALSIEGTTTLTLTQEIEKNGYVWVKNTSLPEPNKGEFRYWSKPINVLGLKCYLFQGFAEELPESANTMECLTLKIDGGRLSVGLAEHVDMLVRYDDFGRDSLNFLVETFDLGPGGLSLSAKLILSPFRVKGLNAPFLLKHARLEIVNNQLEMLSVAASGTLPKLLDEAPISLSVTFTQNGNKIELDELVCELGSKGEPIFSRGTRFKFEINVLELRYSGSGAERNFFFEVTGSAQFTPNENEFSNGLLENLKSVRCDFVKAPLSDDFANELKLMVELNEPVTFNMYNLFRMEIRSIGFEPKFDEFSEPGAAIAIGGQCEFAEIGDVVSAEIDFHACRIGFPRAGESLPQIHFEGLRVDISSPEGFRIAGRVDRYESDLIRGFAGEGTVQIPGFPELSAAFSFVRLREDINDPWVHAWFVAIEASKMSIQVAPLPFYLRQIGMGFGYRYTLPLIKTFENPEIKTLQELIEKMLKALDQHQTLARIDSWEPDPEKGNRSAPWTVALEAVMTTGTQQAGLYDYNANNEKKLKTFIAQILAALRSDFTLLSAAKIWFPVSVDDFFNDTDGMRNRPLARGFMIYSAPQRRFLVHAAKHDNPYLGKPNDPWPKEIHGLFKNSHFEATMLIEPGLFHAELGWPDRLMYRWSIGSLHIEVRAGVLMRIEDDAIVQGIYLSARGGMELSGGVDLGFTGVRLIARVDVFFATRLMTALYLSRPLASKLYGEIGLDLSVRFSVQAWLRLKIGFVKINFNIRFSASVQIVVGMQIGWSGIGNMGFRGRATVVIGVFGRSLRAGIAVGLNESAVNSARQALLPYMSSFLAPGEPPKVPDGTLLGSKESSARSELFAATNEAQGKLSQGETALNNTITEIPENKVEALSQQPADIPFEKEPPALGESKGETKAAESAPKEFDFVLTQVKGIKASGEKVRYVWIMPGPNNECFYPIHKETFTTGKTEHTDGEADPWVNYATLRHVEGIRIFNTDKNKFESPNTENQRVVLKTKVFDKDSTSAYSLHELLAACYTLKLKATDNEEKYFPESYSDLSKLVIPKETVTSERMSDARLKNGDQAIRNPKRELDSNNEYDRVLMASIDAEEQRLKSKQKQLDDQALGMQSFLLQSFYDDLVTLATQGVQAVLAVKGRPTLLDLGLVIEVDDDAESSHWLMRVTDDPQAMVFESNFVLPGRKPFKANPDNTDTQIALPFLLNPVIDFYRLDFAAFPPIFNNPVTFRDEEVLAVGWELAWGGGVPDHAPGADINPESYLKCYNIRFSDGSRRTLMQRTVKPADLLGVDNTADDGEQKRLASRYQITVSLSELFGENLPAGQMLQPINVTITPEDQSGGIGESYTFMVEFEPTLTPLPADNASCLLDIESNTDDGYMPVATVTWTKPLLPSRPGVAGTDGWELILRPLRIVPMGAYPTDAVEEEERGLMSATGQSLQDGDLLLDLDGITSTASEEDQERRDYTLEISKGSLQNAKFIDNSGKVVDEDHPSSSALKSFVDCVSCNQPEGRAWRLYLRARQELKDEKTGEVIHMTYSGLTPVRLFATLSNTNEYTQKQERTDKTLESRKRPLPHFEWPELMVPTNNLATYPRATGGNLHIPVLQKSEKGSHLQLEYIASPSRARVISLDWPAIEAKGRTSYAATAEFAIYATDLDKLVNTDLSAADTDGFGVEWHRVARVLPADLDKTAQTPATLADAQNWHHWPPSLVATKRWQKHLGISDDDSATQWPGWYSWAESYLEWPDPLTEDTEKLEQLLDALQISPIEIAFRQDSSADEKLAAWLNLGKQLAGGKTHPWLALIIGWIASQRMAAVGSNTLDSAEVDQIEIISPKAVTEKRATDWLSSNTASLDPSGWNALGHLGLSITLSLRDPITGYLRAQSEIRHRIDTARAEITKHIEVLNAGDLELTNKINEIEKHINFTAPIKSQWSCKASADQPELSDAALRMLNIALHPLPCPWASKDGKEKAVALSITVNSGLLEGNVGNTALDIVWRNRPRKPETLEANSSLSDYLDIGDEIFVLAKPSSDLPDWPKNWTEKQKFIDAPSTFKAGIRKYFSPLPLEEEQNSNSDIRKSASPFGVFNADPSAWVDLWPSLYMDDENDVEDENSTITRHFGRALTYIDRAFEPEADTPPEERKKAKDALLAADNPVKMIMTYQTWSARFFKAAPLTIAANNPLSWLKNVDPQTTVAAPKNVDPIYVAADVNGRLQLTLPVEEEWATTRSYAIAATDRYAQLRASMLPYSDSRNPALSPPLSKDVQHQMLMPEYRADVHLQRIRKLEPPQILGAHLILIEDLPYNVLSVARHSEEWLHNANLPLRRKISFGATTRSYSRKPLQSIVSWGAKLYSKDWIDVVPTAPYSEQSKHNKTPSTKLPDFSALRMTHLSRVPALRLGGDVHVTAAEPFWYQSSVTLGAYAGLVRAKNKQITFPPSQPVSTKPLDDEGSDEKPNNTVCSIERSWSLYDVTEFGTVISQRAVDWKPNVDDSTKRFLKPQAIDLKIRLPRLVESLPMETILKSGIYSAETKPSTFGNLPDPALSLQVTHSVAGAEAALLRITPISKDSKDSENALFEVKMVDDLLAPVSILSPAQPPTLETDTSKVHDWNNGIYISVPIRRDSIAIDVDEHFSLPTKLITSLEDGTASDHFPAIENMRLLLPLLMRLNIGKKQGKRELVYTDPLYGPAWLCLPHIRTDTSRWITQNDLASGLMLIADPYRRHAAAQLCLDMKNKAILLAADSDATYLLLARVSAASFVYVTPTENTFDGVDVGSAGSLKEIGIAVWIRIKEGDHTVWSEYKDDLLSAKNAHLLVIAEPRQDVSQKDVLRAVITKISDNEVADDVLSKNESVRIAAKQFAQHGFQIAPLPTHLNVYVQRGNTPREVWCYCPSKTEDKI